MRPHCDKKTDNRKEVAKVSEWFYWSCHKVSDRSLNQINHELSWACTKDSLRLIWSHRSYIGLREVSKWSYFHRTLVADCAANGFVEKLTLQANNDLSATDQQWGSDRSALHRLLWSLFGCQVVSKCALIIRWWVCKSHWPVCAYSICFVTCVDRICIDYLLFFTYHFDPFRLPGSNIGSPLRRFLILLFKADVWDVKVSVLKFLNKYLFIKSMFVVFSNYIVWRFYQMHYVVPAFMPVLITSNFDDDLIKNEWVSMETPFSHFKSMGNFLDFKAS